MAHEFRMTRRVEFAETDMAGIVHFGVFFLWMEQCEHAFYRALGLSVVDRELKHDMGWPRVKATCEYHSPLRFEDEVGLHLVLRRKGRSSLSWECRFTNESEGGKLAAVGHMTVVHVSGDPARAMGAPPIPESFAAALDPAPEA